MGLAGSVRAGGAVRGRPGRQWSDGRAGIQGVAVALKQGGLIIARGLTDEHGWHRIDPVPAGLYRADVQLVGENVELMTGALPITITLRADGGGVRGTVKTAPARR